MNFKKIILSSLFVSILVLTMSTKAFAHVTVKPGEAGVGQRLNFVVSVPTEEDVPTTQVRLVIPEGMASVRPNVKPGWNIQLVKSGEGETERVSEIIWSGGSIPAEQRDEFVFSAQAPAVEGTLIWKAYQTYGNGLIVSWDADPKAVEEYTKNNPPKEGEHDHDAPKPYSSTSVINDLEEEASVEVESISTKETKRNDLALGLSVVALGISIVTLYKQQKKNKNK